MLGEHRIGCGDGRDAEFLRRVVGEGASIDAAFLDPPYNVKINGHANAKGRHREFAMASGEMSDRCVPHVPGRDARRRCQVSRDGAVHFICMDWRHMDDVTAAARQVYDDLLNICVWNKSNAGMGSLYRSKHEMVFVYKCRRPHRTPTRSSLAGMAATARTSGTTPSVNSMAGSRREDLALHPTVKPVAMVADALQDVTRRGDLVFDMFLGSGTTLIAAERTGRQVPRAATSIPPTSMSRSNVGSQMTGGTPQPGAPHERPSGRKGQSGNPAGRPEGAPAACVGVRHHLRQER